MGNENSKSGSSCGESSSNSSSVKQDWETPSEHSIASTLSANSIGSWCSDSSTTLQPTFYHQHHNNNAVQDLQSCSGNHILPPFVIVQLCSNHVIRLLYKDIDNLFDDSVDNLIKRKW
uniref:Uncharacterized protein n=1 Tax=Glossina brevipalpis TaxID=37001 RepID=A0A1A9WVW5_9MUSC